MRDCVTIATRVVLVIAIIAMIAKTSSSTATGQRQHAGLHDVQQRRVGADQLGDRDA